MGSISIGQVWQNGRTAVKIQKGKNFKLITFDLVDDHRLQFRETGNYSEKDAIDYLKNLNCTPTNKILTAVEI